MRASFAANERVERIPISAAQLFQRLFRLTGLTAADAQHHRPVGRLKRSSGQIAWQKTGVFRGHLW